MKKVFALVLLALFVGNVFADPALIIKQKAKDTANQNNAQQAPSGQSPAARPGAPAAVSPVPAPLTPDQKTFLVVVNDLAAPKAEDAKKLANNMMAMGFNPDKSAATIQKLAKNLTAALEGKPSTPAQRSRIVSGIRTVMNGASMPAAKVDPYIADVAAILKIAGANATAIAAVTSDLKTLRAETLPTPVKASDK